MWPSGHVEGHECERLLAFMAREDDAVLGYVESRLEVKFVAGSFQHNKLHFNFLVLLCRGGVLKRLGDLISRPTRCGFKACKR